MSQSNKIVMPKKLLKKWLAALRSGKYKQAKETLYDPATKGFCCLGVLEHCAMNGQVETNGDSTVPLGLPSKTFEADYNVVLGRHMYQLAEMNDGLVYEDEEGEEYVVPPKAFTEIADYIEANSVGV